MVLEFQNKTNTEIIRFLLMHFRFALDLPDIYLWNIDLLDTHLDCWMQMSPVNILFFSITSSRRLQEISSRHRQHMSLRGLQYVSSKLLQGVFKTSSRHLFKTSSGHDFKRSSGRIQDMSSKLLQDVFKTNKCLVGLRDGYSATDFW